MNLKFNATLYEDYKNYSQIAIVPQKIGYVRISFAKP